MTNFCTYYYTDQSYIVLKKKQQRNKLTIKFLKLSKRFDRSLRLPVFPLPP